MIDFEDTLPGAYRRHGLILARINSCLNPLLYGLTNTIFRKGFENFYFFLFNRKEYSFSIEAKKRRRLNERRILNDKKCRELDRINKKENLRGEIEIEKENENEGENIIEEIVTKKKMKKGEIEIEKLILREEILTEKK